MLDSLITSKTRLQLLLRFFANPNHAAHLRQLAADFSESTNAVRVELKRLVAAKLLTQESRERKILYSANIQHPLYPEIASIVRKTLGIDKLVETIVERLGNVHLALLVGDYAKGNDTGTIEIVIVGDEDRTYLQQIVELAEGRVHRRIQPQLLSIQEFEQHRNQWKKDESLIIWKTDEMQPPKDI
ncbi:transcriptional regulator [Heliomicrobium modesticaldum]|uniref:transcriptional regulator n=1 Tax=Heliomicrobium modesticaldum TaxID=35701 RepID=UPI00059D68D3|nr:transcriptional regulator [Heliomicrobium modesticaldum]